MDMDQVSWRAMKVEANNAMMTFMIGLLSDQAKKFDDAYRLGNGHKKEQEKLADMLAAWSRQVREFQ